MYVCFYVCLHTYVCVYMYIYRYIKYLRKNHVLYQNVFFRWGIKDDLSQKIHGIMMFSLYLVKMLFLFPGNMILPFCQKKQKGSSPEKILLKMIFLVFLKKIILILQNMVFLLIEKLKMIKKVYFYKKVVMILCFLWKLFYRRFHILLSNKKT